MSFSKILSYLTHPILTTTYMLMFALFQTNSYLYYTITDSGRLFFIGVTVVLTIVAPLISVGYMVYAKQVSSIYLDIRQERIIPMSITGAYTLGLFYLFSKFSMPPVILAVIGAAVVGVVLTLLVTIFWKISAHMMGMAGLTGTVIALSKVLYPVSPIWIIALFIITGLVGTARIKQDAHSINQVLAGWLLGLFSSYLTVMVLTGNISI